MPRRQELKRRILRFSAKSGSVLSLNLQQAFDSTSRVLFGSEIGELRAFAPYLREMMLPYGAEKSAVTGKGVMISIPFYQQGAKFIGQDELALLKIPPLHPNEIKDIDSLFAAAVERAYYCGNKLFGRNFEVNEVDNCVDSSYIFHSHNTYNVKYGAYCSYMRESEFVFGSTGFPQARSSMRVMEGVGANRCFESFYATSISNMYYSFNCIGCQDCIFAFNLRSKRHVIGNLELPRERYLQLRDKLVSEIADELRSKKRIFSIADIARFGRSESDISEEKIAFDSLVPPKVEEAYRATTRFLFGQEHSDIKKYGPWLLSRAMQVRGVKGARKSPTYKVKGLPVVREIPADRLVTLEEGMKHSAQNPMQLAEGETPGLKETLSRVAKIALFSVEFVDGQNTACVDTPSIFTGSHVYKLWDTTKSKYSTYSTGVIQSEHIFGGYLRMLDSRFCINCFDSTKLSGCFEADSSYSSRNCYFCHNVENAENCIFCFNAKSLSYAVCNTPVGMGEYSRIRKILLDCINSELSAKKSLSFGIFALREGKSGKSVVKNRK